MKFIDYAKIYVKSGDGGDGAVSFRREKFVPKGGPDGGDGGKGGDVIVKVEPQLSTLLDLKYKRHYKAKDGRQGDGSKKSGKSGADVYIKTPPGSLVKNAATGEVLADLTQDDQEFVVAEGGAGGKGNARFASSTNQTPRYAQDGEPGKELEIILELKLIADVGIVGFPNVGKSTLISTISAAKPKIADYPFTTLVPNLGIVKVGDYQSFVAADIPGLLEGASEGKGLGDRFLRHVERTRLLVFLIESTSADPEGDYETLFNEITRYKKEMVYKKRIVCFSKADLADEAKREELAELQFDTAVEPMLISAVTRENIDSLKWKIWEMLG